MIDEPKPTPRPSSDTPTPNASSASRAGSGDTTGQPFQTAAEMLDIKPPEGIRDSRLSQSPGLVEIEGSQVPGYGDGSMVNHVTGPGQAPVDPIAAGLDMQYSPKTAHELRAPTLTGEMAAGPRPSTYVEKPGDPIPQSTEGSGETVRPFVPATGSSPAGTTPADAAKPAAPKTVNL